MPPTTPSPEKSTDIQWAEKVIDSRSRDFGKLLRRYEKSPDSVSKPINDCMDNMRKALRGMGHSDAIDGDTAVVEQVARELRAEFKSDTGADADAAVDEAIIAPLALIHALARRMLSAPPPKKIDEKPTEAPPSPAPTAKKTPPLPAAAKPKKIVAKPLPKAATLAPPKPTSAKRPPHETPQAPTGQSKESGDDDFEAGPGMKFDPNAPVNLGDSGIIDFMPADPQESGEPADAVDLGQFGIVEGQPPVHVTGKKPGKKQ
ncbi:MAG: hypothetical protein PHE68_00465 [Candidatus Peribacteraceae bacterium]|nr:hypothetical protein [Candidatus Peribacteraceae bacterium]MDD5074524.1 hypothetical protein [Candidatus Peribacteraceae bacterium]